MTAPALPVALERQRPRLIDLATMSLADAPDLWTAIDAGIMHGLSPREAMRSAFHKWLGDNGAAVQSFGLANFYAQDGLGNPDTSKAFVNHKAFMEFAVIMLAEQARVIARQGEAIDALQRTLPRIDP